MPITRFAPSPTGHLHLGHAFSAVFARAAAGPNGTMQLRIEDIDTTRCRPEFITGIETDLVWLGFDWPKPVRQQSAHLADYAGALARLDQLGVLYPCFCTRADLSEPASAPHGSAPIYPGTCRRLTPEQRQQKIEAGTLYALRLDLAAALALAGRPRWRDLDQGWIEAKPELLGDAVLGRKDIRTSYHLAVAWDDALQGVEIVTRGTDLFEATHLHRLLQVLLGLPAPVWRHHPLLLDAAGKRFAKRDHAPTLKSLREAGKTPDEVLALAVS